jgi:uroporphyrinogen III methyltransferase/synthase
MKKKGMVYLVGAGPGDVGLLTLRGAELLQRADVVVYDALINRNLLRMAPPQAEIIYGGKRTQHQALTQDELSDLLIAKARQGKCVVRLKGGDPYIFGRGGEEAETLAAAHVAFEVVPGVSSVVAGPNYAGIPLTHRDHSSSFTVLTGHEDPAKPGSPLDLEQIARIPGTKVILMGVQRIRQLTASMIAHGLAPSTPASMIRWGSIGRQQAVAGTLANLADLAEQAGFKPPAVTVIGDVVKLRAKLNWYEKRPLFGQRIVVTRAREQAGPLVSRLLELGAEVLEIPTIKIVPPEEKRPLVEALEGLGEYEWVVFTSVNGVSAFFDALLKAYEDIRAFGMVRVAAVGPGTAAKLKELHLRVDVTPEEAVGRAIASALAKFESIENLRILLPRAEQANPDLPRALEALGAIVDDVPCYRTVAETEDRTGAGEQLLESGADWITFTSGSTVDHFHARFDLPALVQRFPQIKCASIGPETSKRLVALGLKPALEPRTHTIEGLVEALESQRLTGAPRPGE